MQRVGHDLVSAVLNAQHHFGIYDSQIETIIRLINHIRPFPDIANYGTTFAFE